MKNCFFFFTVFVFFVSVQSADRVQAVQEDYFMIMESKRNSSIATFNHGLYYEQRGDTLRAIGEYKQAITLNPQVKEPYINLGAIYFELGLYQKAIENYLKAIELDPRFELSRINLGMVYYALGRFSEAIQQFEAAQQMLFATKDAAYFLGRAYYHVGLPEKAIEILAKVITHDNTFYPAHFDIACIYMTLNKFNLALEHFERVRVLSPYHERSEQIEKLIKSIKNLKLSLPEKRMDMS